MKYSCIIPELLLQHLVRLFPQICFRSYYYINIWFIIKWATNRKYYPKVIKTCFKVVGKQ